MTETTDTPDTLPPRSKWWWLVHLCWVLPPILYVLASGPLYGHYLNRANSDTPLTELELCIPRSYNWMFQIANRYDPSRKAIAWWVGQWLEEEVRNPTKG